MAFTFATSLKEFAISHASQSHALGEPHWFDKEMKTGIPIPGSNKVVARKWLPFNNLESYYREALEDQPHAYVELNISERDGVLGQEKEICLADQYVVVSKTETKLLKYAESISTPLAEHSHAVLFFREDSFIFCGDLHQKRNVFAS